MATRYLLRVARLRHYLASFTITPVGIVLFGVLIVALGLFVFGPPGTQAPALVVGVILLVGLVGGVPFGIAGSRGEPQRAFIATDRRGLDASTTDPTTEEALWRKERERRERDGRSS
jgi:hypothetical protein